MDRRDVLKLGSAATLALLAPSGIKLATRAFSAAASTIVLADPRYSESVIFAGSLERQGARVVALGHDVGEAWFNTIVPRLSHDLRTVTGLTLESDHFILERLAEGSGGRTCYAGLHDWRGRRGLGHTLSGAIDLDPIAAALSNGKEEWTKGLGEALLLAKDGIRNERKLQLEFTPPAGRGPRFFASWLMRWTA
jgi:hypothetical protein